MARPSAFLEHALDDVYETMTEANAEVLTERRRIVTHASPE